MPNNLKQPLQNITFSQTMMIGVTAGIAEVTFNHPLWVIKTRMQRNYKPVLQPQGLYHGLVSNMITMVPLIALRISLAEFFQNSSKQNQEEKNVSAQLILSSFIGGGIPSILSSPLEFVRTKQANNGLGFLPTYQSLIKKHGHSVLSTGLLGTTARDGIYTCGFFALVPILKNKFKTHFDNAQHASIASKLSAGAIAAFASQPLDTIKIEQQINIENEKIALHQAMKKIMARDSIFGFFKGSAPRILRVISAVTIISTVNEEMSEYFENCHIR